MPTPRLIDLFRKFLERARERNEGQEETDFLIAADITIVRGDGRITVNLDTGQTVTADPTTDEPFLVGQRAWVSRTESGAYIVHGGIR